MTKLERDHTQITPRICKIIKRVPKEFVIAEVCATASALLTENASAVTN
jgi:hypothetical protein